MKPLTAKQERFVDEYMIDLNATRALKRAGYGVRNARQVAHTLLHRPEVAAEVEKRTAERRERAHMKADEVLAEMAKLARANMGNYLPALRRNDLSELTPDQTAAISEVTMETFVDGKGEEAREVKRVKLKLHDKQQALLTHFRHLGLLPTRTGFGANDPDAPQELPKAVPTEKLTQVLLQLLEKAREPAPHPADQAIDVTPSKEPQTG